jgi:hypothetical protein
MRNPVRKEVNPPKIELIFKMLFSFPCPPKGSSFLIIESKVFGNIYFIP